MKTVYFILLLCITSHFAACRPDKDLAEEAPMVENSSDTFNTDSMKLKITIGQKVLIATMYNNPTTRDFTSLLPLTLTLTDYNGTEKISDLPKKLSAKGAPAGYKPSAGDITIYAPWGNLAVFYKDFSYSSGLIVLGKINSGIDALKVPGSVKVKMELIQ